MGFSWQSPPPDEVFAEGLKQYERDVYEALYQLALSYAPRIESWLKSNAKWQDRTGNLRASLFVAVERLVNEIAIHLAAGLDYYVFVMTKRAGYYDIISEGLDHFSPLVWNSVKELLR